MTSYPTYDPAIWQKGFNGYFIGSAVLLALLFIGIALITFRIKPEFSYLLPLAPAAIASLYIN